MTEDRVNETNAPSPDESSVDFQRGAELEDMEIPSAYDTLMQQHRDAILRIHSLETENQNLMKLLKQSLSGNALSFADQATNPADLLARIQILEGNNPISPAQNVSPPAPTAPPASVEAQNVPSSEIEQLRVQNNTLMGHISKLDGQLQELQSERSPRRRRKKSSSNRKQGLLGRLLRK